MGREHAAGGQQRGQCYERGRAREQVLLHDVVAKQRSYGGKQSYPPGGPLAV
ncbi:MAG: hypothetical protein M3308_10350 [Actinomycetota bacterium]|nr:hypothetical protein [Actinomycetota bacterium]